MIYLGSDHGGHALKLEIAANFKKRGIPFQDLGNNRVDPDDDYPDFAFRVAEKVSPGDDASLAWKDRQKGILLCRSAAGMVIAANKVRNIRAVSVIDRKSAMHSRQHNDANVLCLSGDWMTTKEAFEIIEAWLSTEFSREDRHLRRLNKIREYEKD